METRIQKRRGKQKSPGYRILAVLVMVCLLLSQVNFTLLVTYATNEGTVTFEVGENVTATLENGILTLSGMGDTDSFTAETAPFKKYADHINQLEIEGGITSIGSFLFYGLGQLEDELVIPESVVKIGEYAFSGDSLDRAPKFKIVRNMFEQGEITRTDSNAVFTASNADAKKKRASSNTAGRRKKAAVKASGSDADQYYIATDSDSEEDDFGYFVEVITEQEIERPETLFFSGQTGMAVCTDENVSFIESVVSAGYQVAEGAVSVTLDDNIEVKLPVVNGQVCLPECPEEIDSPYEENGFYQYQFAGWRTGESSESAENSPVLEAGEFMEVQGEENLYLYSAWEAVGKNHLTVKVRVEDGRAFYSVADKETGEEISAPAGYVFMYQWQEAEETVEGEAVWSDIQGAEKAVYTRVLDLADSRKQFRCGVKAEKMARSISLAAAEPVVLYSEAVNAAQEVTTVFVDQTNGHDDSGSGTAENPYQTIEKAAQVLRKRADGGSMDNNKVVIIGTYTFNQNEVTLPAVPMTITGGESAVGSTLDWNSANLGSGQETSLNLGEELCLESIKVNNFYMNGTTQKPISWHIYCCGHKFILGENISLSKDQGTFYLYGFGRSSANSQSAEIAVLSGKVIRIVGYVRSGSTNNTVEANGRTSLITIGGGAVSTIVAGSASGSVTEGKVTIKIEGGTVDTLVGGNQGFNAVDARYTGKTNICVTGGTVKNIYAAGTGRNASAPTYDGSLELQVTGGTIGNIYGAGSAAYVVSEDPAAPSSVNISVTGGTVGNVFAAGKGGDKAVTGEVNEKEEDMSSKDIHFGSLTGNSDITIGGTAVVTGNVYASGEGYQDSASKLNYTKNAYLKGNVSITVKENAVVGGNVYGGGKGINDKDGFYAESARVEYGSTVNVNIEGGTVKGKVFGGGENGKTYGKTNVNISGGTIEKSVYGGALGVTGIRLVYGGSTVNMTGGWIKGNLYGSSELSNDGPDGDSLPDLNFVNLIGGTVSGNVFGGGYQGIVNGSTHLHIGLGALDDCAYYQSHLEDKPALNSTDDLTVVRSVYAGGDFGGDEVKYDQITVNGTSHVYIDGTGYDTGTSDGLPRMEIKGGVFASGASCDAGKRRLITLENYGEPVKTGETITGATRTLTAIQRADRVLLKNSHVRLNGQADIANPDQTALYSLNHIGDKNGVQDLGELGNALVLQGGSTLILDAETHETANFKSIDESGKPVTMENLSAVPDTVRFNVGTVFRISSKYGGNMEQYGEVSGYTYMAAEDAADAYAYARAKTDDLNPGDGGFVNPTEPSNELDYTNVGKDYRYWKIQENAVIAQRYAVLTAQELEEADQGYCQDGYSVASGSVNLPPAETGTSYKIESVTIPTGTGLTLVEAAKAGPQVDGASAEWQTADINSGNTNPAVNLEEEKKKIENFPSDTFGLFMKLDSGFTSSGSVNGKVISAKSAEVGNANTIIGKSTAETDATGEPKLNFYLTYDNNGINSSKNFGTVEIKLTGSEVNGSRTEIIVNVEIVTKASRLSNQTVDLYATQSGSYTGRLMIPSGASRKLMLKTVEAAEEYLKPAENIHETGEFSVTMQPVQSDGWHTEGLMAQPYDLGKGINAPISLGTTDSRYEAPIDFTLKNLPGYVSKEQSDTVTLSFLDESDNSEFQVTLNVYWKDSVVSDIAVAAGKEYGGTDNGKPVTISSQSAFTAAFTLGKEANVNSLWLELRGEKSSDPLPVNSGVKLTLMLSAATAATPEFYSFQSEGNETKIQVSEFKNMSGDAPLSGVIKAGANITVIMDFGAVSGGLVNGDYSLRLRDDTGADSKWAGFTINNAAVSAGLSGDGGLSRGTHTFKLKIASNYDTRFADGAEVVLTTKDSGGFPEGLAAVCGGQTYYPSNKKIYLPLCAGMKSEDGSYEITLDSVNTAGFSEEIHNLTAEIFPVGKNAGEIRQPVRTADVSYTVKPNPVYGLHVKIDELEASEKGSQRVAAPGAVIGFKAAYSAKNTDSAVNQISLEVQKKNGQTYEAIDPKWEVNGNVAFGDTGALPATQEIKVSVPPYASPGTYRLIFILGDRRVPYNIIIQ